MAKKKKIIEIDDQDTEEVRQLLEVVVNEVDAELQEFDKKLEEVAVTLADELDKEFTKLEDELEKVKDVKAVPGPQGEKGERGDPGPPGVDGLDGRDGTDGEAADGAKFFTDLEDTPSLIEGKGWLKTTTRGTIEEMPQEEFNKLVRALAPSQQVVSGGGSGGGGGGVAGANGDIQINASNVHGVVDGMNVDQTGNARGALALDIQSDRSAVTEVASGPDATAIGLRNEASGTRAVAIGWGNTASGIDSVSVGATSNVADSTWANVFGYNSTATDIGASAHGVSVDNAGNHSYGAGYELLMGATADNSIGLAVGVSAGDRAIVSGASSVGIGFDIDVTSTDATGVGRGVQATGIGAVALGSYNDSSNTYATTLGYNNSASGIAAVAIGDTNTASANRAIAIGDNLTNSTAESTEIGTSDTTKTAFRNDGSIHQLRTASGLWQNFNDGTDDFGFYNNAGTPEGVVAADIGSIATDTTNGAIYVKTTDTVNTGWVDVGAAAGVWTRTGTDLSPTTPGDDVLLNVGETLTVTDLTSPGVWFSGAGGLATVDATNFTWVDTDNTLRIRTTATNPGAGLLMEGNLVHEDGGQTINRLTGGPAGGTLEVYELGGNSISAQLSADDEDSWVLANMSTASYNFGIGTDSPAAMAHISTGRANTFPVWRAQNTADTIDFFVTGASPEGVITADPGSIASDAINGDLYIKNTGVGNTGWLLLASGGVSGSGVDNQIAVWNAATTLEGTTDFTYDSAAYTLTVGLENTSATIQTPTATTANTPGGDLSIGTGNSLGTADGPDLTIFAGSSPLSNGGDVTVTGGSGTTANGGVATLQGGNGDVLGGSALLKAGSGGAGTGGDSVLQPGTGTTADGVVRLVDAGTGNDAILDTSSLTADRTFTFPDVTGTFAVIADGFRNTFDPDGTNSGINVGAHTAEPSAPVDGDIFYDSTANALKARINGAWVSLGAGGGLFPWTEVTGTSQSAAVNNGYITNNAGLVTVTIPDTAAVGDVVRVAGSGAGGWAIAQNAGESIHFANQTTTVGVGGSLASTNRYDTVELICIVANTEWLVLSSVGNITVT